MPLFRGSAPALVTPFTQDGIDFDAFGKIIDFQLENQSDALIICGTTGESSTMSDDERTDAIKFAVERVGGRIPIVAGTGSNETAHVINLSRRAEDVGCDGLLLVTPYYNKTSSAGVIAHYKAIADRTKTPIIMYNVPSRTGLNMKAEIVAQLAGYKNIHGVKEASGDLSQVIDILRFCRGKLAVYSGMDEIVLPILAVGGDGVITTVGNITPRQMHDLCWRYFTGDTQGATQMQFELKPLIDALFLETNPIPVKAAMDMMGMCSEYVRLPLVAMTQGARATMRQELVRYRLLAE
ncbi:MAG: 4-hydroxy-tetrahydrodipicolinate synthase [Eubacteriales bacterium]|nr:4-hydroxy-tetrahydrodipicolinate synthase [Eubacteriales bacterium]